MSDPDKGIASYISGVCTECGDDAAHRPGCRWAKAQEPHSLDSVPTEKADTVSVARADLLVATGVMRMAALLHERRNPNAAEALRQYAAVFERALGVKANG